MAVLLVVFAGLALLASPALALSQTPTLGGTYPSSPGVSLTPRVFGFASEVSTSGLGHARAAALTAAVGDEGTITLYAQPSCAGPEVATGTASELENSGIQVAVQPGSTTSFSATHTNLTGVSECSNTIGYRQVSDPPAPPTVTAVSPASPADDNLPRVLGDADPGSTVGIYADSACSGSPIATGSATLFSASGIEVAVPDNSTSTFYARASWAELPSACSSTSIAYQEVSAAPGPGGGEAPPSGGPTGSGPAGTGSGPAVGSVAPAAPKLRTVPGGRSNNALPLVTGSISGASGVQIYRNAACTGHPVASGPASQLAAGFGVPVVENTTTKFFGEAIDTDGKASACSEPVLYTEDSAPPQTRITFGPGVKTRKRVAVFRFTDVTDDPPGTTFLCKFDRGPWKACQTPLRLPRLRLRMHALSVRAIDAAGNEEAAGTSWRFKVVRAG